jgi:hypothetical protein
MKGTINTLCWAAVVALMPVILAVITSLVVALTE